MVCENFENVIVMYNGANQFELGFAGEYEPIRAVVWCAGTGNRGFNALGKILRGEVNPSGRTPDTFVYDMERSPWWNNGEKTNYENLAELAVEGMNSGVPRVHGQNQPGNGGRRLVCPGMNTHRTSFDASNYEYEWGFRGMALTDFFRNNGHGFMNADAALVTSSHAGIQYTRFPTPRARLIPF